MTELQDIENNRNKLQEHVKRIRSDQDLNEEAKQRMIADAYSSAMERHKELVAEHQATKAQELKALEKSVFKVHTPGAKTGAEKEAYRMSFRDALSRAESVAQGRDSVTNLEGMLARAERQGDRVQAEAAYHLALERGYEYIVDAYLADRPYERENLQRYREAKRSAEDPAISLFAYMPPLKPTELRA
jgi:hypothetical protein